MDNGGRLSSYYKNLGALFHFFFILTPLIEEYDAGKEMGALLNRL
jgi:hypothetical protein